jgi:hypothetical protein
MKDALLWSIFWALVVVAIIAGCFLFIPVFGALIAGSKLFLIPFTVLFLLGATLIVLTVEQKIAGLLKVFFLLAGASTTAILVFIVLHNLMFSWLGIDEPVFFILAVFVCPIAFLVGAIGSIVLGARESWPAKKPRPKARPRTKRRAKRKRA